ncbi:hypothetical protein ILUMI_20724 [Ignelater luminosus]|uniref:Uncharacterized protein n=1 Tax=Ignelater luminosus TaxID=2038154 RepID=A0A8K0CDS6_IGNLU|nr:hypothetical protein ILUMI_20724 [Ignelater luminosus]
MEKFAYSLISAGIFHGLQQRLVDLILERIDQAVRTPPLDEMDMQMNELGEYEPEDLSEYSEWEVEEDLLIDLPDSNSSYQLANSSGGEGFPSPQESILSQAVLRNNIKKTKRRKKTTQTTLPNGLKRKTQFRNRSESRHRTRSRSPIIKRLTPGP